MMIKCLAQLHLDSIYQGSGEENTFHPPLSATRLHFLYATVDLLKRSVSHILSWVDPLEAQSHLHAQDETVDIKAI